MIISTTSELKNYVSVAQSFVFADFIPYINKAANTFTRRYVGELHTILDVIAPEDANKVIKESAREHLRSAIGNFGYFLFIPLHQLQMDSSGLSVNQTENRKSPDLWQINDLRREVLRSGHESMDLLLEILEKNPSVFTDYATNYSSINNELLVSNATIFSKYYEINNSRQTFLALMPTIRVVQDQYIKTFLCPELITALKGNVSGNLLLVKEAIQKAMVAFTIAKVSTTGLFILDEKGLRIDFENLNFGRRENPSYGKSVDQLNKLSLEQIANGTQYLNIAKEIIENNLGDFNQCASPLIKSNVSGSGYSSYDTKGVLSL